MTTEIRTIRPGRYRHYKGNFYEVIATARYSETEEWLVIYRCLYGDGCLWVRPLAMFLEEVVLDGQRVSRFAWAEDIQAIPSPTEYTESQNNPQKQIP